MYKINAKVSKMNAKQIFIWTGRTVLLLVLFLILFVIGSMAVSGLLPDRSSEPGLVPNEIGFMIFGVLNTILIISVILSSRWYGWKLALALAFAYYGSVTFLPQIESWYFLSEVKASTDLLQGLFIMGLPIAFIYIPLAVLILGKRRAKEMDANVVTVHIPKKQLLLKVIAIALVYIILYWGAGYFIAWQNPELRTFYGSPGAITPFWEQTVNTFNDGGFFPFQFLRGLLWTLCAVPLVYGSKLKTWHTAVLLGLFFTVPQVLGLILENPLMPSASVRLSHIIEGFSSNFTFGLIIVWLLHREHTSFLDLFGGHKKPEKN